MPIQRRRLLRIAFSLRTLLIVTTFLAVIGGRWLMLARTQRDAVVRLKSLCLDSAITLHIEMQPSVPGLSVATQDAKEANHFLNNIVKLRIDGESSDVSDEMADCIAQFRRLERLELFSVYITRYGLATIENTAIEELSLLSVNLNEQTDDSRSLGLPKNLRELEINVWHSDMSLLSMLQQLTELRKIKLGHVGLNDDHVAMICSLEKLKFIELGGHMAVSAKGFANVANLKYLSELHIDSSDASVDNSTIDAISQLPNIRSLTLPARGIHANHWSKLANCDSLHSLTLIGCPENESELAGISDIQSLRQFAFADWGKPISEEALGYLSKLNQLETVRVDYSDVSLVGAQRLIERPSFSQFTEEYWGRRLLTPGFLHLTTGDPRGTPSNWELKLNYLSDLSGRLAFLENEPKVSSIGLSATDIVDSDMEDIAGTPQLSSLRISRTAITDNGIKHLGDAKLLTDIEASGVPLTCEEFPTLPNLERIRICGRHVTPDGWEAISRLPKLKSLVVEDMEVSKGIVSILRKASNLERLQLENCVIEANSLEPLANHAVLVSLDLRNSWFEQNKPSGVGTLNQLQNLDVSRTNFDDGMMNELETLRSLKELSMRSTVVSAESTDSLLKLASLKNLHIQNAAFSIKDVRRLRERFAGKVEVNYGSTNDELNQLQGVHNQWASLSHCDVSDELLTLIAGCERFQSLDLSNTLLDDDGLKSIAELDYVRSLDISETRATDVGIKHLDSISAHIRNLKLDATAVTPKVLHHLSKWKILRQLEMENTDVDLQSVLTGFPIHQLEHLRTSDIVLNEHEIRHILAKDRPYIHDEITLFGQWWTWERASRIVGNRHVQEVMIGSTSLGEQSVDLLTTLPFLRRLSWHGDLPSMQQFSKLRQCKFLQSIVIDDVRATQRLIDTLSSMPRLSQINLLNVDGIESLDLSPLAKLNGPLHIIISSKTFDPRMTNRLNEMFSGTVSIEYDPSE